MRKRKRRMASEVSHSSSEKWMVIGDEEESEREEEKVESIWMASRRAILFFVFLSVIVSGQGTRNRLPLREDMISRYMESDIIATDKHNLCR